MDDQQEKGRASYGHGVPGRKETGFAHFLSASRYSWQGFRRLLREAAFRHELACYVVGLILFAIVGADGMDYLVFTILALILFSAESLNTAIEEVVDRVSPEFSLVARHAKDLGSFAVFCLLVANGLFVGSVIFF